MKKNMLTLRQLDGQLLSLKKAEGVLVPKIGWVRTIRKAFGMTIKQLAKRLGVNPSRIVKIETSELDGAITLHTLQAVAESLDCTLVYGLVPKRSLEETINNQAKKIASNQMKRTAHTMELEAQNLNQSWLEEQTEGLTNEYLQKNWKNLWSEE